MKRNVKITRKKTREHLEQLKLACELGKIIKHCFPDLVAMLKQIPDPRNQSYITYPGVVLLMTRILSSVFYISSMRKTSEEFNSDTVIENIWLLFTAWLFTTLNRQVDTRNGWNLGRPSPKVILNDGPELLFTGIREQ